MRCGIETIKVMQRNLKTPETPARNRHPRLIYGRIALRPLNLFGLVLGEVVRSDDREVFKEILQVLDSAGVAGVRLRRLLRLRRPLSGRPVVNEGLNLDPKPRKNISKFVVIQGGKLSENISQK